MKSWKVALGALIVSLVAYHLGRDFFLWFPGRDANMASFSEAMVRLRHRSQLAPRVLCLGSSRMRHGLVPEVMEEAYGLAPGSVQNYGMDVGTPWMALKLLEKSALLSDKLRLVFFDVEPWQFNGTFPANTRDRQIFYRLANLAEKMHQASYRQRAFYLADLLVPFMSENRPIKMWAEGIQHLVSERAARSLEVPHAWRRGEQKPDQRFAPAKAAARHMEGYEFDEEQKLALAELVNRLVDRGVKVVLFQMPATNGYMDAIMGQPEFSRAYDQYLKWVRRFDRPQEAVWLRIWERPGEFGFDDSAFIDYGHLSKEEASVFTSRFLEKLPPPVAAVLSSSPEITGGSGLAAQRNAGLES